MKHRYFLHACVGLMIGVSLLAGVSCTSKEEKKIKESPKPKSNLPEIRMPEGPRQPQRLLSDDVDYYFQMFNDSNHTQLAYAKHLGIEPLNSTSEVESASRELVKITSCDDYGVDYLTHSVPYLVPESVSLLSEIGRNFKDSLARRGYDGYKIKVTSVLRTPDLVKDLKKVNINATDSSTHMFGTTFDLSWKNFYADNPSKALSGNYLKALLGEVLLDLREQKKCLVKYEHKTTCFHITAAK